MLPGKQYTPEDLLAILRRRFWLLLVPCAVLAAVTSVVARKLPDTYKSEAVILVVPQQIPEEYVRSTIRTDVGSRLATISQQILSRTRLERIIDTFKLYPEMRKTGIMQDVVEKMRRDISVNIVKGDAFQVSYVGPNPRIVQQVTASIASLFIEESLRDRSVLAEGTNQFLEVQLGDARRRLIEQEKKLEAYRMQNAGRLPTQVDANIQGLQNVQMQIESTIQSLNRDRDQQLVLQRQLADLQVEDAAAMAPTPAGGPPPVATPEAITGGTTAQQLDAARELLASLQLRYKPDYPDIPRVQRLIRDLEKKLDQEALGRPVSDASQVSPRESARKKRLEDLQGQLDGVGKRIAAAQANEARLRGVAEEYQRRIDGVPARESEMTELTRDYSTLQDIYASLLAKKEESNISANLERRQIGEQFKLLDPAQVAERPFSPNRQAITGYGIAGGLALGFGLLVLLEYRDTSFKTDDEIATLLALPVLAVVPVMQSVQDRRREVRWRLLVGFGLGTTVLCCSAVVVYTLVR